MKLSFQAGEKDSKPCVKERLSKSLTINPVEGQMDSESTESSSLQDKDSAVETSISISLRKRGSARVERKVRLVSTSIWARLSTESLAMDCPVCRRRMLSTLIARDDPAAT
ncbi:hypothetical protein V6N13_072314 [Hibiscus sabdariffa]